MTATTPDPPRRWRSTRKRKVLACSAILEAGHHVPQSPRTADARLRLLAELLGLRGVPMVVLDLNDEEED
jgi:hypothetical protein